MSHYENEPYGDRRQSCRSATGEPMQRMRFYLPAEVWPQLDALVRLHADESIHKTVARIVRDAYSRSKATDDDSTRTQ